MGLLYRFRRENEQSVFCTEKMFIQGSKYITMADPNEVLITIDIEKIVKETKADRELIKKTGEFLREHIINSYFISCFATEDQTDDMNMWQEYAGKTGFCLIYEEDDIKNALEKSMLSKKNKYFLFREINYSNQPIDITLFVLNYWKIIGSNVESEKAHKKAANLVRYTFNGEESKKITNCMFNKIGTFTEKTQKRIVLLSNRYSDLYNDDMVGIPVKPIKVICSSLMSKKYLCRLEQFSINNNIEFEIKECKFN